MRPKSYGRRVAPISSIPEQSVLLTRPLEQSRAFAACLAEDGVTCQIWPLTRIVPVMTAPHVPPTVDGLIVTSVHGLRAFAALTGRRDLPVLAVGDRTAEAARALGFRLALSAGRDARALKDLALQAGLGHLFYPRGRDVAADLAGELATARIRVSEAVVYAAEETGAPPAPVAHALASGRIAVVTVWSARNAAILARHFTATPPGPPAPVALAISSRAAAPLDGAGFADIVTVGAPTAPEMRRGVLGALGLRA